MITQEEQDIIDIKEEVTLQQELMPTVEGILREEIKEDGKESNN